MLLAAAVSLGSSARVSPKWAAPLTHVPLEWRVTGLKQQYDSSDVLVLKLVLLMVE